MAVIRHKIEIYELKSLCVALQKVQLLVSTAVIPRLQEVSETRIDAKT